jgi:hypothetical protein
MRALPARGVGIHVGELTEDLEKTGEEAQISHRAVLSV